MNERAQELMNQAGEKVLVYLEATEGFAVEQAPLLAQEIVRYGILNNSLKLAFFLIVPSLVIYLSYRFGVHKDTWQNEPTSRAIACILFGVLGFILTSTGLIICFKDAVPDLCKALVAPRLYIIEQIKDVF